MRVINSLVFVTLMLLVAGCSGQKIREGVFKGIYDSSRIESMRGTTPAENATRPDMNYDQYTRQRNEQIQRDSR